MDPIQAVFERASRAFVAARNELAMIMVGALETIRSIDKGELAELVPSRAQIIQIGNNSGRFYKSTEAMIWPPSPDDISDRAQVLTRLVNNIQNMESQLRSQREHLQEEITGKELTMFAMHVMAHGERFHQAKAYLRAARHALREVIRLANDRGLTVAEPLSTSTSPPTRLTSDTGWAWLDAWFDRRAWVVRCGWIFRRPR